MADEHPIAERLFGKEQAYWTAFITLVLYNFGVVFIGLAFLRIIFPVDRTPQFYYAEGMVVFLMILSIIGMFFHAANRMVSYARWSYLLSLFGGLGSFITFLFGSSPVSIFGTLGIALLIAAGGFIAFSMHIEHAGRLYTLKTKIPPEA